MGAPFKLRGFSGFGNSPLTHKGDGNHPKHHDTDYFTGTTRKVIDKSEDVVRKGVKKGKEATKVIKKKVGEVVKDPIGSQVKVVEAYVKPYKKAFTASRDWLKKHSIIR